MQCEIEINLSQDKLKRSKKVYCKSIAIIDINIIYRHNPLRIKKIYNKIQNLFQNEIKQIKWKINLLQVKLE